MRALLSVAIVAFAVVPALANDGQNIPTRYNGFLVASQTNGTGWGDHRFVQEEGIVVGSELDALYACVDATNLWIGITGNLPNKLASSQAFVILIDADNSGPKPAPNLLATAGVDPGIGGGHQVLRYLDGTILEPAFDPETAIVVNRFAETTYVNSWYLPLQAEDPWSADLVSLDPNNGLYMSAWMDTTNILGVDADETKDGPVEQGLAATALKGLRLRLDRAYFGIGSEIKIMVLLAAPGDNGGTPATYVSNQILPPLSIADDPVAPGCVTPPWPANFDENYLYTPLDPNQPAYLGFQSTQFATVAMVGGTPLAFDGSDIPGQWPPGSLVATQQIHTCFGDAVPGTLSYTIEGSELDQLFVRADDQYLYIAATGNVEPNGNKVSIWVDADPNTGQNTLSDNSPAPPDPASTMIYGWRGRTFDAGFAPENAYILNNWLGTLYIDAFHLLQTDVYQVKQWQGSCPVNGTFDDYVDPPDPNYGGNPNGNRFVLNHTNNAGVLSCTDPGSPGQPETATTGIEAKISLTELGLPAGACDVKVWVVQGGGDSVYLSNMALPSFTPGTCGSVGSYVDPNDPNNVPFDFGQTDPLQRGNAAFAGNQFATAPIYQLGDVNQDCCINPTDVSAFIQVLLGLNTDPTAIFLSDITGDGLVNGTDIQSFVDLLLSQGPCP